MYDHHKSDWKEILERISGWPLMKGLQNVRTTDLRAVDEIIGRQE